jgi:hypothetical protein
LLTADGFGLLHEAGFADDPAWVPDVVVGCTHFLLIHVFKNLLWVFW